jgi:hypothetical protein
MDHRFWGQRSQPPVTELDDGWEVLSDPRWPGGLYRQRSEPHHSAPRLTPKAVAKRHPLGAFGNQAGSAKGSAVDLMV